MRGLLVAGLLLTACSDPVVGLSFRTTTDEALDDTSCVTSVEVYAAGTTYPANTKDYVGITVAVDHPPTYKDLIAQMRGKFNVPVPPTGLGSIEVYGWNGDPGWGDQLAPAELVFYARTPWDGEDDATVELIPNISCARSTVTVRPLDLVAFAGGNYQCAAAAVPDVPMTAPFADTGTFAPLLYRENDLRYFGGKARGSIVGGVTTFDAPLEVGPHSCLAVGTYTGGKDAISCASTAGICGHQGEIEVSILPDDFKVPTEPNAKFGGATVGAVFSTARAPIAGATIEVDPETATVGYLDLDAANKTFKLVSGNATTASGLFVVWSNKLTEAQVTANGRTATVHVGSIGDDLASEFLGTTVVVMQ